MRARAFLILVPFLIVACGATASSPSAPPSTTPSAAEITPGPASPVAQAACPEVPEPSGTTCVEVTIHDFAFDPPSVAVPTIARIVFINDDSSPHSIEWADGTPTSPALATGASTEREFSNAPAGLVAYVCGIHGASMSGEIVIDDTLPTP